MAKKAEKVPEPAPKKAPHQEFVPDYTTIVGLKRTDIADIAQAVRELDLEIKEKKAKLDVLKEKGAQLLSKHGVKSVMANGLRVTRIDGSSSQLSKTKLFELGVSEKVIAQATVTTPWTGLKVSRPGEGKE